MRTISGSILAQLIAIYKASVTLEYFQLLDYITSLFSLMIDGHFLRLTNSCFIILSFYYYYYYFFTQQQIYLLCYGMEVLFSVVTLVFY